MPSYTVIALEKFVVRTIYKDVEADSPDHAEQLDRDGEVAHDDQEIQEGYQEYLSTESVEES